MSEKNAETPGTWLSEIEGHLWALRPETLGSLYQAAASGQLEAWLTHERAVNGDLQAVEAAREEALRRGRPRAITGGVARVGLKGVLMPMTGLLAMFFGDLNPLDDFKRGMREAMADDEVGAIVVDVDSPGGVVDGIPEAAKFLRDMRGKGKPIVAVANTLAASAAYWIASQADEMVVSPSGAVGSIGVYATHRDFSGQLKMLGVDMTLISAGKFKTEGNPYEPLSDEAREHIQEDVDDFYGMFVADVAKGRGVKVADVKGGYGEGRVLGAKRALAANLVDRVETIDETVGRLSSRSRGSVQTRAEAEEPEPELAADAEERVEPEAQLEEAEVEAGADTEASEDTAERESADAEREREKQRALGMFLLDRRMDDVEAAAAAS